MTAWAVALLSRQQPPVAPLPAVGQLELEITMRQCLNRPVVQRRLRSPQAGDEFGSLGKALTDAAQRVTRRPRHHDFLLDEANRIALTEPSADVVTGRRRDGAGTHPL